MGITKETAEKMPLKELGEIKKNWELLDKLMDEQKATFFGAWKKVKYFFPAEKSKKHLPMEQQIAYASGVLTRAVIKDVFVVKLDGLIEKLLGELVTELLGNKKKNAVWKRAHLALKCIRQRLFGMVAPQIPNLLKQVLSDPDVVPVIRGIILDNPHRVIQEVTPYGWAAGFINGIKSGFEKRQVEKFLEPILAEVLKVASSEILAQVDRYKSEGRAAKNKCRSKSEYHGKELETYKPTSIAETIAKLTNTVADETDAPKDDAGWQQYAENAVEGAQRVQRENVRLQTQLNIWRVVTGVLALLLVLSWFFIAFSLLSPSESLNAEKRPSIRVSKAFAGRVSHIDLELGEGGKHSAASARASSSMLKVSRKSHRKSRRSQKKSGKGSNRGPRGSLVPKGSKPRHTRKHRGRKSKRNKVFDFSGSMRPSRNSASGSRR